MFFITRGCRFAGRGAHSERRDGKFLSAFLYVSTSRPVTLLKKRRRKYELWMFFKGINISFYERLCSDKTNLFSCLGKSCSPVFIRRWKYLGAAFVSPKIQRGSGGNVSRSARSDPQRRRGRRAAFIVERKLATLCSFTTRRGREPRITCICVIPSRSRCFYFTLDTSELFSQIRALCFIPV